MSILQNIAKVVGIKSSGSLVGLSERELIDRESQIGRQLFGPIPKGHRREFFCLDDHTWVWHEEWTDQAGRRQHVNTRYEVRQNGILKIQGNGHYVVVSGQELKNLHQAIKLYHKFVLTHVYNVHAPAARA